MKLSSGFDVRPSLSVICSLKFRAASILSVRPAELTQLGGKNFATLFFADNRLGVSRSGDWTVRQGISARTFAKTQSRCLFAGRTTGQSIVGPEAESVHASNLQRLAAESVVFDRAYVTLMRSRLAPREQIESCLRESTRCIVSPDGWKLCLRDRDKNELYNLRDDPAEERNLFYDIANRHVVKDLRFQICRWQEQVGDKIKV